MDVPVWPSAPELLAPRLTLEPLRIEHAGEAGAAVASWLLHQGVTTFVAHVHPDNVASAVTAHRLGMSPTPALLDGEVEWRGRPPPAPD